MKPARPLVAALATLLSLQGCGRKQPEPSHDLSFENVREPDTSGLSKGRPLINTVEAYRGGSGVLRVRGRVSFPDGVRIQVSIYPQGSKQLVNRLQVIVQDHRFESPPIIGPQGPLPRATYRIEYLALFNDAWQGEAVMRRIDGGRDLRGPGITRDRVGGAAFYLVEERAL